MALKGGALCGISSETLTITLPFLHYEWGASHETDQVQTAAGISTTHRYFWPEFERFYTPSLKTLLSHILKGPLEAGMFSLAERNEESLWAEVK